MQYRETEVEKLVEECQQAVLAVAETFVNDSLRRAIERVGVRDAVQALQAWVTTCEAYISNNLGVLESGSHRALGIRIAVSKMLERAGCEDPEIRVTPESSLALQWQVLEQLKLLDPESRRSIDFDMQERGVGVQLWGLPAKIDLQLLGLIESVTNVPWERYGEGYRCVLTLEGSVYALWKGLSAALPVELKDELTVEEIGGGREGIRGKLALCLSQLALQDQSVVAALKTSLELEKFRGSLNTKQYVKSYTCFMHQGSSDRILANIRVPYEHLAVDREIEDRATLFANQLDRLLSPECLAPYQTAQGYTLTFQSIEALQVAKLVLDRFFELLDPRPDSTPQIIRLFPFNDLHQLNLPRTVVHGVQLRELLRVNLDALAFIIDLRRQDREIFVDLDTALLNRSVIDQAIAERGKIAEAQAEAIIYNTSLSLAVQQLLQPAEISDRALNIVLNNCHLPLLIASEDACLKVLEELITLSSSDSFEDLPTPHDLLAEFRARIQRYMDSFDQDTTIRLDD